MQDFIINFLMIVGMVLVAIKINDIADNYYFRRK